MVSDGLEGKRPGRSFFRTTVSSNSLVRHPDILIQSVSDGPHVQWEGLDGQERTVGVAGRLQNFIRKCLTEFTVLETVVGAIFAYYIY